MREQHGVLGHRIGPGAGPSFRPELSLAIILEAKQGEMKHAVDSLLVPQDVLDEAKSVVAHVGESGAHVPAATHPRLLIVAAEQLLLEHPAVRWPLGGGAAGGDRAAANVPFALVMNPDPCIQAAVEVGLSSERQHPVPKLLPKAIASVEGMGDRGSGHEDGAPVRVQRVGDDIQPTARRQ